MAYIIKYVYGHYNVYTHAGEFLFSADSEREALEEIERDEAFGEAKSA